MLGGFTVRGRASGGALVVGCHDARGALCYAGSVGTGRGFSAAFLGQLRGELAAIEQPGSPFHRFDPATLRSPWGQRSALPIRWVRPLIVANVGLLL